MHIFKTFLTCSAEAHNAARHIFVCPCFGDGRNLQTCRLTCARALPCFTSFAFVLISCPISFLLFVSHVFFFLLLWLHQLATKESLKFNRIPSNLISVFIMASCRHTNQLWYSSSSDRGKTPSLQPARSNFHFFLSTIAQLVWMPPEVVSPIPPS